MPTTRKISHSQGLATINETAHDFDHDHEGSTEFKIPAALQQKQSLSSVSSSSSSSSSSSDDLNESRIQHIQSELYDFQAALHSNPSSFLEDMNSLVRESFPTFYEFVAILQQQPDFDKKTFLENIAKTKTALKTPRGVTISEPKQVVRYLAVESAGRRKQHELIYQAANSKIFKQTSIIESLTTSDGLIRPELNAAASIKDCSFEISLKHGKPQLVAECFLNVTLPCRRHHGKSASRWTIVGLIAEVYFCPHDETLSVELLHLSPAKQFSDRELRSVAKECVRRSS